MVKEKEMHLIVKGRVQGVNFRNSVKKLADSMGIRGWIRNEVDGNVSVVCQGGEERLLRFIEMVWESPGLSNVKEIVKRENKIEEKFNDFKIIREGGFFSDKRQSFNNLGKGLFANRRV